MKIFHKVLFTLLLLETFSLYGQDKIDSLSKKDIIAAINEYQKLQSEENLKINQYLELAGFYAQIKKSDSASLYLDKVWEIDSIFSDIKSLLRVNLYYITKNNEDFWDNWLMRVLENYDKYISPIKNYDYCKALLNMRIRDASFYNLVYYSEQVNGKFSPTTIAIWELKEQISYNNIIQLDNLVKEYGWPLFSEYGYFAPIAVSIVQHADLNSQKRYLPIITEAYNQGEAYFNWVAMLTDRILLREKKPQIYGSQSIWNPHLGRYVLYEVEDPKATNELRIKYKIGEPLSEELFENMYNPTNYMTKIEKH